MKIAILSDTHSQLARISKALELARARDVGLIVHCGDIEDGTAVRLFEGRDVHFVFGNCDWDKAELREAMADAGATLHESFGHLEIDGKKVAFVHGHEPGLFRDLEHSGAYDYLFHGHTHVARDVRSGPTRIINPGALHRARVKTFVVLNPKTGEAESVVVG
jgi:putative phosphoesterase